MLDSTSVSASVQNEFAFPAFIAERKIYTVHQLVMAARGIVERDFAAVWVEGEVSNLRKAASGHIYFTLKDADAQLPVVLFRRQALLLRFAPVDGMQVLTRGTLSIYESRGQMQLIAEALEPRGAGALQVAFEQLRDRLRAEGLFAAERKRPLPSFPRIIGVITSLRGAVIHDIVTILRRRQSSLSVLVYPALVQGEAAAAEMIAGLLHFNTTQHVDMIVLARGGGSAEDLACYNNEGLARAIVASAVPVVSAVGHETDVTIADFAADVRAPTPSAAAELITTSQHRVAEHISQLTQRIERGLRYQSMRARERYERLALATVFVRLQSNLARRHQRVDELRFRMEACLQSCIATNQRRVHQLAARLNRRDAARDLRDAQQHWTVMNARLARQSFGIFSRPLAQLHLATARLKAFSPLAVLERGYALVFTAEGRLVKSVSQLRPGGETLTRIADGSLASRVTTIHLLTEGNEPIA
jgi:exodeoxyribonuclease VII large subunit